MPTPIELADVCDGVTIEVNGSTLRRKALTGDVTSPAGSAATTIPANTVTKAQMADIATDRLLGRDTAATGDPEEITVAGGLEFTGSGGIQRSALTGDATAAAGSNAVTIPNDTVTNAKSANMAQSTIKGRAAGAGTGDPTDLTADQASTVLDGAADPLTRKSYVDGLMANLGKRQTVRAATTANITISTALNNGDTLDGVTLATGNLVLVKNQTAPAENGIYVVGVSPARDVQFDTFDEHPGSLVAVQEGTSNADTLWLCTTNVGGVLNTNDIVFSQLVVSGAITQLTGDVTAGPGTGSQAATIPGASLTDAGNSGTALTIDLLSRKFGRFKFTLTGNVTLTINNPTDGGVYVFLVKTGAGGFTVTWPGSVLWPNGTTPTITVTASKVDLVTLVWESSTSKFYGSINQNY